jgi:hypothetical protein
MSDTLKKEFEKALESLSEDIDDDMVKVLEDTGVTVDPEYLHKIKMKVENLLSRLIKHYVLEEFISDKYRYRIDYSKFCNSEFYKKFNSKQDIDGNRLRYGHDHIPETLEEWLNISMPDYMTTEEIYTNICEYRRILKNDLLSLNKIAKRYKVVENED